MALDFDPWPRQWQNGLHTARRSYSTQGEFYLNTRLGTGPLKASYEGLCTIEKLVQESEEE